MSEPGGGSGQGYQVLARKYRPQVFADLIGQEAMVRTLSNAFATERVAHAFVLTGVRGVGKTTTARIVARGLNCIGSDGTGGMTVTPCGVCSPCTAIAEGRHVDVLEMDAATHTQVDRMRELLASVPYRPAEARMKVYIIDEVHMLSTASFNALLKTLEEPPEHVKFIFATTEIRKVPVTVLSRCQRFDLRRVEPEVMLEFLCAIAAREGAEIPADAMALITRAAEGSVRDALSLLDQAIAHGGGQADLEAVRAMLGLADRGRVLDLFDSIMKGDVAEALAVLGAQYAAGADPLAVLRDLAEVTHWVSLAKAAPALAEDPTVAPEERRRGAELARRLAMPSLARMWQMLLKALDEVAAAPNAMMAAEMAIIRLTHVADLPSPGELVRRLQDRPAGAPSGSERRARAPDGPAPSGPQAVIAGGLQTRPLASRPEPSEEPLGAFGDFAAVLELIREEKDLPLLMKAERCIRLVSYAPGRIEFEPTEDAPMDLAAELGQKLAEWTGRRWAISITSQGGAPTAAESLARNRADLERLAIEHPMVQSVLAAFPGARIVDIRLPEEQAEAAVLEPWLEDDWDPFDAEDEED